MSQCRVDVWHVAGRVVVSRGTSDMGCTDNSQLRKKKCSFTWCTARGLYDAARGTGHGMPSGKVHRYVTVAFAVLDTDLEVTTSPDM